jgi:rubrerythrin
MDVEEEKRGGIEVLGLLYSAAERVDPKIAADLRRIHEEEQRHREEIQDMLLRADPQAFSVTAPEPQDKS